MARMFENPFGNHETVRRTVRGIGAVAIMGGMITIPTVACTIDADKYNQNSHALAAREDLLQAVAASTGGQLTDISGPNRNMAGWFIDQDHMMVALGKPADIPASLEHLEKASDLLEGSLKFNGMAKQAIDAELARSKADLPTGDEIPAYSERLLNLATSVHPYAYNGAMIDANDVKIGAAGAGAMAIGAGMMWLASRRPEE